MKCTSKPKHVTTNLTFKSFVFNQLRFWLSQSPDRLSEYQKISSAGPRRGQLTSFVWRRKHDFRLVVLKSFGCLDDPVVQTAIINEIVIPYVIDSPKILKPTDWFIKDDVRLLSNILTFRSSI